MVVREPWSASNPFLTHGPVESPSQLPLHSLPALSRGARPSPISPKGSKANPFTWLTAALPNLFFHRASSQWPKHPARFVICLLWKNICDRDIVILEHGVTPKTGDVVAALIDNESTLKTFVMERGKAHLKAENPRYPKLIPAGELMIQGVMVALIRKRK